MPSSPPWRTVDQRKNCPRYVKSSAQSAAMRSQVVSRQNDGRPPSDERRAGGQPPNNRGSPITLFVSSDPSPGTVQPPAAIHLPSSCRTGLDTSAPWQNCLARHDFRTRVSFATRGREVSLWLTLVGRNCGKRSEVTRNGWFRPGFPSRTREDFAENGGQRTTSCLSPKAKWTHPPPEQSNWRIADPRLKVSQLGLAIGPEFQHTFSR
jgi:hypothetical protein